MHPPLPLRGPEPGAGRGLLAAHDAGTKPCSHVRDRLQTVDARIAKLQALRKTLTVQLQAAASGPKAATLGRSAATSDRRRDSCRSVPGPTEPR